MAVYFQDLQMYIWACMVARIVAVIMLGELEWSSIRKLLFNYSIVFSPISSKHDKLVLLPASSKKKDMHHWIPFGFYRLSRHLWHKIFWKLGNGPKCSHFLTIASTDKSSCTPTVHRKILAINPNLSILNVGFCASWQVHKPIESFKSFSNTTEKPIIAYHIFPLLFWEPQCALFLILSSDV